MFLAFTSFTASSQTDTSKDVNTLEHTKYIYCELVQQDVYWAGGSRTTTFLNFGSNSKCQNQKEESDFIKLQNDGIEAFKLYDPKQMENSF